MHIDIRKSKIIRNHETPTKISLKFVELSRNKNLSKLIPHAGLQWIEKRLFKSVFYDNSCQLIFIECENNYAVVSRYNSNNKFFPKL